MELDNSCGIKDVPPFLWAHIFSNYNLDSRDLENAAQASTTWHGIIKCPLPPHIMGIVFRNLSVADQRNCMSVSKVWKSLMEHSKEVKKSVVFDEVAMARMRSEEKVSLLKDRVKFLEIVEVHNRDPSISLSDIFNELLNSQNLQILRLVTHSKNLSPEDEDKLLKLLQCSLSGKFKWLLLVVHLPPPGGRIEVDVRVKDASDWTVPWYMNTLEHYTYPGPESDTEEGRQEAGGEDDNLDMAAQLQIMFNAGHGPGGLGGFFNLGMGRGIEIQINARGRGRGRGRGHRGRGRGHGHGHRGGYAGFPFIEFN